MIVSCCVENGFGSDEELPLKIIHDETCCEYDEIFLVKYFFKIIKFHSSLFLPYQKIAKYFDVKKN